MIHRLATPLVLLLVLSSALLADYPPALKLRRAVTLAGPGDAVDIGPHTWTYSGSRIRGYEWVAVSLEPKDAAKPARWVAVDSARFAPIVEIADLDALCGEGAAPGQRITATKQVGGFIGTSGGYVIRDGRCIGNVGEGWSVAAFDEHFDGNLWLDDPNYEWPPKASRCAVLLAKSADGKACRFFGVLAEKIVPLGLEGGPELSAFTVYADMLCFRRVDGKIGRLSLADGKMDTLDALPADEKEAPLYGALNAYLDPAFRDIYRGNQRVHGSNALDPEVQFGLMVGAGDILKLRPANVRRGAPAFAGRLEGVAKGVTLDHIDLWPRIWHWNSHVSERHNKSKVAETMSREAGLDEGFLAFARNAADGPHLFVLRPTFEGDPTDLGPLPAGPDGRRPESVRALRVLPSGEIAVAGIAGDGAAVMHWYIAPFLDTYRAVVSATADDWLGDKATPVEAQSLYAFDPYADRGYDCIRVASDGNVYFASMPHHPTEGTRLFRYVPATKKIEVLGDIDAISGNTKPGLVPNMCHVKPVEIDGRIVFTGEDPFYGHRYFPGETEENAVHRGSPIVAYDMKTGVWADLGIPLPKQESIFSLIPDRKRRTLYLRCGYWDRRWFAQRYGEDGKLVGDPKPLAFEHPPKDPVLAFDGNLYDCVERPRTDKESGAGNVCDVVRYNPATGEEAVVATIDVIRLNGGEFPVRRRGKISHACSFAPGQDGSDVLYGLAQSVAMVVRVDLRSGEVSKVALLHPDETKYPLKTWGQKIVFDGKLVWFEISWRGMVRTTKPTVCDLRTGVVTNLPALRDQRGRWLQDVTMATAGPDGTIYVGAQSYVDPGDKYTLSRGGYSRPGGYDSVFGVLRLDTPLKAE